MNRDRELPPILFFLVVGNVLHAALSEERCHLSSNTPTALLSRMLLDLGRQAGRVGLKINTNKIKVHSLTSHRTLCTRINGQIIKGVDKFVYLGTVISNNGGTELDVTRQINIARSTFAALSKI